MAHPHPESTVREDRFLSDFVEDEDATSFFQACERVQSVADFLRRYNTIRGDLPRHAKHNHPGKTLLCYALRRTAATLSAWREAADAHPLDQARSVGVGIMAVAVLGAPMLYWLAAPLTGTRGAALAVMLYLLSPALTRNAVQFNADLARRTVGSRSPGRRISLRREAGAGVSGGPHGQRRRHCWPPIDECGYATPTPCTDGRRVYAL